MEIAEERESVKARSGRFFFNPTVNGDGWSFLTVGRMRQRLTTPLHFSSIGELCTGILLQVQFLLKTC